MDRRNSGYKNRVDAPSVTKAADEHVHGCIANVLIAIVVRPVFLVERESPPPRGNGGFEDWSNPDALRKPLVARGVIGGGNVAGVLLDAGLASGAPRWRKLQPEGHFNASSHAHGD